jgi:hypothetical protein
VPLGEVHDRDAPWPPVALRPALWPASRGRDKACQSVAPKRDIRLLLVQQATRLNARVRHNQCRRPMSFRKTRITQPESQRMRGTFSVVPL